MTSIYRLVAGAGLVLATATASHAVSVGSNFDGTMSLIYNDLDGGVFVENSPNPNPSVQSIIIESAGNLLQPGNLPFPPANIVTDNPDRIEISWPGNSLGTSAYLGTILAPSHSEATLLGDLTITYNGGNTGDLIHGSFGQLQSQPVMPLGGKCCRFFDVTTGQFFDPPMAFGYEFQMDSASLFTKVGLPLGLGDNFKVTSSEGVEFVGEGGQVEFSGVSSFTVTGVDPLADPNDPVQFPVYLEFSMEEDNAFSMTPILVPEPSSFALAGLTLCAVFGIARRRS